MSERKWLHLIDGQDRKRRANAGDFPYGLWHDYAEVTTLFNTASTTFVSSGLSLTTADLPAGNYRIDWSYIWDVANIGTRIEIEIRVDGNPIWNVLNTGDVGVGIRNPGAGFSVEALDGVHTIEIFVRRASGGGSVTLYDRRLALQRWD